MFIKLSAALLAATVAYSLSAAVAVAAEPVTNDYIPYQDGVGDPRGLTLTPPEVDDTLTGSIPEAECFPLPNTEGGADALGLSLAPPAIDDTVTGSVKHAPEYMVPYTDGSGDPHGLTLTPSR